MRSTIITKQYTNKDTLSLNIYFSEINKIRLLTIDNEVILARKIKDGDAKAFEMLINSNLRFVISIAKQYQNKGLTLSDLINEGNLGLIKAAERFDESRGFKFISYAVWWIRRSILQAISENSRLVRIPLNKVDSISKVAKAFAKLEQEYHREPMPEEIAEILHFQIKVVEETLEIANFHSLVDTPLHENHDKTLHDIFDDYDTLSPDKALVDNSLKLEIDRILATLTEKDAVVLRYYFGLSGLKALSINEIAIMLGHSHEAIRKMKISAIGKLKGNYNNSLLRPYLG